MRTIDILALIASCILAIAITIFTLRKSVFTLRPLPAFFMFFGPATIFIHMMCHIGEIGVNTAQAIYDDTFTYTFRLYSLMLMAIVLVATAGILLLRINKFLIGGTYGDVIKAMVFICFVSAPTIPFTPIGSLPVIACFTTLSAMPFTRKLKIVRVAAKPKKDYKEKSR